MLMFTWSRANFTINQIVNYNLENTMSDITVAKFSESIGVELNRLLDQMAEAGIKAGSGDDFITDENNHPLNDESRKCLEEKITQALISN